MFIFNSRKKEIKIYTEKQQQQHTNGHHLKGKKGIKDACKPPAPQNKQSYKACAKEMQKQKTTKVNI